MNSCRRRFNVPVAVDCMTHTRAGRWIGDGGGVSQLMGLGMGEGGGGGVWLLVCWLKKSAGITSLVDLIKPGQWWDYENQAPPPPPPVGYLHLYIITAPSILKSVASYAF